MANLALPSMPMAMSSSADLSRPINSSRHLPTPSPAKGSSLSGMKASPHMTLAKASPSPDLEEYDDGDDDDEDDTGRRKRGGGGGVAGGAGAGVSGSTKKKLVGGETKGDYKYINEISQMVRPISPTRDTTERERLIRRRRCSYLEKCKNHYPRQSNWWRMSFEVKSSRLCVHSTSLPLMDDR